MSAARKILSEHTHGEDEVRFFVEGAGLFCLHLNGKIFQILCEKNDLISVPANTRHWFDMGGSPSLPRSVYSIIRKGWVAHFTGDKIADAYPGWGSKGAPLKRALNLNQVQGRGRRPTPTKTR